MRTKFHFWSIAALVACSLFAGLIGCAAKNSNVVLNETPLHFSYDEFRAKRLASGDRELIAGAVVGVMKRIGPRGFEEAVRTKSDDTGAFSLQDIPEGYYAIQVEAQGYAGRDVGPYDNRNGHSYHDLDALLARAESLRGQVVDTDGNPVQGV